MGYSGHVKKVFAMGEDVSLNDATHGLMHARAFEKAKRGLLADRDNVFVAPGAKGCILIK